MILLSAHHGVPLDLMLPPVARSVRLGEWAAGGERGLPAVRSQAIRSVSPPRMATRRGGQYLLHAADRSSRSIRLSARVRTRSGEPGCPPRAASLGALKPLEGRPIAASSWTEVLRTSEEIQT